MRIMLWLWISCVVFWRERSKTNVLRYTGRSPHIPGFVGAHSLFALIWGFGLLVQQLYKFISSFLLLSVLTEFRFLLSETHNEVRFSAVITLYLNVTLHSPLHSCLVISFATCLKNWIRIRTTLCCQWAPHVFVELQCEERTMKFS